MANDFRNSFKQVNNFLLELVGDQIQNKCSQQFVELCIRLDQGLEEAVISGCLNFQQLWDLALGS